MNIKKEDLQNVRHINVQSASDSNLRYVMLEQNSDDEINLLDLWLVITKRRLLLLSVLLGCFLIGVFFSFMAPVKYSYSSAIEIGSGYNSLTGELQLFESSSSVLTKLQRIYIPLETKKLIEATTGLRDLPLMNAKLDNNSGVVFMEIKGIESRELLYISLIDSVVARVKLDHARISQLKRKTLEQSRRSIKSQMHALKNGEQLLLLQNKQGGKKQSRIESSRQRSTENNADDLLLIKLAANHRQQLETDELLEGINIQLNNLLETRAISEPMRSMAPVSTSKKLILLISLVAGLFLSVFVVFMAEFFEKARVYAAENK